MASNILAPLVLIGFFIALAVMVGFAVFVIYEESAQKEKLTTELGFLRIAESQELLKRIAYVNGRTRPG